MSADSHCWSRTVRRAGNAAISTRSSRARPRRGRAAGVRAPRRARRIHQRREGRGHVWLPNLVPGRRRRKRLRCRRSVRLGSRRAARDGRPHRARRERRRRVARHHPQGASRDRRGERLLPPRGLRARGLAGTPAPERNPRESRRRAAAIKFAPSKAGAAAARRTCSPTTTTSGAGQKHAMRSRRACVVREVATIRV